METCRDNFPRCLIPQNDDTRHKSGTEILTQSKIQPNGAFMEYSMATNYAKSHVSGGSYWLMYANTPSLEIYLLGTTIEIGIRL